MAQIQLQKIGPAILTTATPAASEFLQHIRLGEWIHADFKRVRNYKFHKRFFKLLCKYPNFSSTYFLRVPVFQPSVGTLPASGYSGIHEAARCYIPSASAL